MLAMDMLSITTSHLSHPNGKRTSLFKTHTTDQERTYCSSKPWLPVFACLFLPSLTDSQKSCWFFSLFSFLLFFWVVWWLPNSFHWIRNQKSVRRSLNEILKFLHIVTGSFMLFLYEWTLAICLSRNLSISLKWV